MISVTIRLRSHVTPGGAAGGSASPNANRPEFCGDVDQDQLTRLRRRKSQIGLVPDLDGIPGGELFLPSPKSALDQVQVAAAASRKCVGNLGAGGQRRNVNRGRVLAHLERICIGSDHLPQATGALLL